MSVNSEQIAFFKEDGYLLLPGAMDADLCMRACDALWDSLPEDADIQRDDPATHVGPFSEKDSLSNPTNMRSGYRWQLRNTGTQQDLIDLVYSTALVGIAEQLLGKGQLRRPVVNGVVMGSQGAAWPGGPTDPHVEPCPLQDCAYGKVDMGEKAVLVNPEPPLEHIEQLLVGRIPGGKKIESSFRPAVVVHAS